MVDLKVGAADLCWTLPWSYRWRGATCVFGGSYRHLEFRFQNLGYLQMHSYCLAGSGMMTEDSTLVLVLLSLLAERVDHALDCPLSPF